jgi:hypothetical protein
LRIRPAAVTVSAVAIVLVGCGGSSTQSVQGIVLGGSQPAATVVAATGGGAGICGGAVGGTQVIIKGPSGTLLATTTLRKETGPSHALKLPASLTGPEGQVGIYEFSTSIPAGNGPYTIDLVGVSNVVVSAEQLSHLQLTCG